MPFFTLKNWHPYTNIEPILIDFREGVINIPGGGVDADPPIFGRSHLDPSKTQTCKQEYGSAT